MELREGMSYKDREGTIWNCYQHSVYDVGWSWCRNSRDELPGLFYKSGEYTPFNMPNSYDLVEEVGPISTEHYAEMKANDWYASILTERMNSRE